VVPQAAGTRLGRVVYCGEFVETKDVSQQNLQRAIGQLGKHGWELVSATDLNLYFKRQVKPGRKASEPELVL